MDFDKLTDRMDALHAKKMQDKIRYVTAAGIVMKDLGCFVDYEDGSLDIGAGQLVDQDISIEIPKSSVPAEPSGAVRIQLPRISGRTFKPGEVKTDQNGTHWVITLREVH